MLRRYCACNLLHSPDFFIVIHDTLDRAQACIKLLTLLGLLLPQLILVVGPVLKGLDDLLD